jgi:hypothetical protein
MPNKDVIAEFIDPETETSLVVGPVAPYANYMSEKGVIKKLRLGSSLFELQLVEIDSYIQSYELRELGIKRNLDWIGQV